jgi:hypothetical protein
MEDQHFSNENKKAKTHKGRIYLDSIKSKLIEDPKECLFINTNNSSEIMRMILNDLVNNKYLIIIVFIKKRIF